MNIKSITTIHIGSLAILDILSLCNIATSPLITKGEVSYNIKYLVLFYRKLKVLENNGLNWL